MEEKITKQLLNEGGMVAYLKRRLALWLAPTLAAPPDKPKRPSAARAGKKDAPPGIDEDTRKRLLVSLSRTLIWLAVLLPLAAVILGVINSGGAGLYTIFGVVVAGIISIIKRLIGDK